jgi:prefoldin subunit 4
LSVYPLIHCILRNGADGQEEKEYYDDLSTELELADEDAPVLYKLGEAFFHLPLKDARRQLKGDLKRYDAEVEALRGKEGECESGMKELKVQL